MKAFIPAESIHTSLLSVILLCCLIQKTRAQKLEAVPFALTEKVIFFKATVNGSRELNFMFDSGAGITVVNSSIAPELRLTYTGESIISTSGRKVKAKSSAGNSLQMGTLTLKDLPLEVLYLDFI